MTEARLTCGSCGFGLTFIARTDDAGKVILTLTGDCPAVRRFVAALEPFDPYDDGRTLLTTSVYRAAEATISHVDCMAPAAALRAIQVEAGLALPHEVSLTVAKCQEE